MNFLRKTISSSANMFLLTSAFEAEAKAMSYQDDKRQVQVSFIHFMSRFNKRTPGLHSFVQSLRKLKYDHVDIEKH